MVEPNAQIKRAFLAATAHSRLEPIKDELRKRGIESCTPYEFPVMGMSLGEHLKKVIRESDLVVGVVGLEPPTQLFFALGIARGLEKPILVIATPKFGDLFPLLAAGTVVRAEPDNRQAIGFALDQILAAAGRRPQRRSKQVSPEHALGSEADMYLGLLRKRGSELSELQMRELVGDLLEAAGVSIVIRNSSSEQGVDFAVWSDDLEGIVGNPLLVEVKMHVTGRTSYSAILGQVEAYRRSSNTLWALLILATAPTIPLGSIADLPILVVTLAELAEALRSRPFSEVIRGLRNARMYGEACDG